MYTLLSVVSVHEFLWWLQLSVSFIPGIHLIVLPDAIPAYCDVCSWFLSLGKFRSLLCSLILQASRYNIVDSAQTWNHCFCVLLDTWCWDPCGTYWTVFGASLQFNSAIQLCSGVFYILCKAYFSLIFFSTFPSYIHLRDARICHAWSKCRWSFLHCPPEPETRSVWPNSCSGFKVLGWRKDCPCQIFPLLRPRREVSIFLCINILFYLRLYAYGPALAVLFMALCLWTSCGCVKLYLWLYACGPALAVVRSL